MSEPEKTKWNLPWAKPDEAGESAPPPPAPFPGDELEPPPAPFPEDEPLKPKAAPEKPEKSKAVGKPVHPLAPDHPEHPAKPATPEKHEHGPKPKTATVKIESVFFHPVSREVSVQGTVEGKATAARFTEADLLGMATVQERQRYVAGHLKSVSGIDPLEPPEHLDVRGKVEV